MRGYAVTDEKKITTGNIEVDELQTDVVISNIVRIHDPNVLAVEVTFATGVTVADAISLKIQDSMDGVIWTDKKTASVSNADTSERLTIDSFVAGDVTHLPLFPMIRVCITTGTGDSAEISKVMVGRMR